MKMHPAHIRVRVWQKQLLHTAGVLSSIWDTHAEPEVADGVNHLREVKITESVRSYYIKDAKVGEVIIG